MQIPDTLNLALDIHINQNKSTQALWNTFHGHREKIQELLQPFFGSDKTAVFLGSGNANDLNLPLLCEHFSQLHLVDVDKAALLKSVERQKPAHKKVSLHQLELSGFLSSVQVKQKRLFELSTLKHQIPESDLVVSLCIFSQIIQSLDLICSEKENSSLVLLKKARDFHFALMFSLLKSKGQGLFICDVHSSDTLPELKLCDPTKLHSLVKDALSKQNFFHGTHPLHCLKAIQDHPQCAHAELLLPWVWELENRSFAVYAIAFSKK